MLNTAYKIKGLFIIASATSLFLVHAAVAQENTGDETPAQVPQKISVVVPDFGQVAPADSQKLADQIENQRRTVTFLLLWQLHRGGLSEAAKAAIIGLLGNLREVNAIPDLIEEIDFFDHGTDPNPMISFHRFHGYTARAALELIGAPASDYILDAIGYGDFKPSQVDGFIDVLYQIEDTKWALLKLQDSLDQAKTPQAKAQYQLVIDRFKQTAAREHW